MFVFHGTPPFILVRENPPIINKWSKCLLDINSVMMLVIDSKLLKAPLEEWRERKL